MSVTPSSANIAAEPPRKWLMDRINGNSKYGDGERPYGPCCWVPPPVGWCPGACEENCCCRTWGLFGFYKSEISRFWCMHVGFVANVCACILMAFACFSISEDYNLIQKAAFGTVTLTEVNGNFGDQQITLDIGLRAMALNNPINGVGKVVVRFDQFCDLANDGLERYMDPEDCASCNDISMNLVVSAIIAVCSFLPTFFTGILRMYSGYDVNCQKFFATFFSLCTVGLALNVMFTFTIFCGGKFYQDYSVFFAEDGNRIPNDGTPMDPEDVEYQIDFKYKWSWGLMFMLTAAALKLLEVVCHFCIPTPTVTRDRKEQQIYEKIKEADFP